MSPWPTVQSFRGRSPFYNLSLLCFGTLGRTLIIEGTKEKTKSILLMGQMGKGGLEKETNLRSPWLASCLLPPASCPGPLHFLSSLSHPFPGLLLAIPALCRLSCRNKTDKGLTGGRLGPPTSCVAKAKSVHPLEPLGAWAMPVPGLPLSPLGWDLQESRLETPISLECPPQQC